jgi:hypothetical protein
MVAVLIGSPVKNPYFGLAEKSFSDEVMVAVI